MGGKEAHGVTLVHGQGHIGQVAKDEDQLLTKDVHTKAIGTSLKPLEGLLHREQGLQRSEDKRFTHVQDAETSVCVYLNIIMTTIMMGKMEMELPDMYMMNRFMGT